MKKFISLALVAGAVSAATIYLKNNKKAIDRTLDALDELSETAEDTVVELSEEIFEEPEE